ncbi:response regulator transcription factor [Sediminibacillus massiliensis]|uniref:response regulator transcription factor n=1 Tax=Sediminibacillus massiliensis TaxID=1926277 RepID=UPI00098872A6|nr:response regulator transcription factor [Sediminibacillus massiliensis]
MSGLYGVLVVDDEMLIRQGIINYIDWEKEGFQILGQASNGDEALTLVEELSPHIVITDIVMPGMDGIEFVKIVKERYPSIEIIVLSSFENFDYVRSTFQSGVADYILKPKLNGEELIKTLRKVVPDQMTEIEWKQKPVSIEEALKKSILGYSLITSEKAVLDSLPYGQFSIVGVCGVDKSNMDAVFGNINEQLEGQINQVESRLIPVIESDTMVVVLNFAPDCLEAVKQKLTGLAAEYRQSGRSSSWLMSIPFKAIDELNAVYEEHLLKMKDYAFYLTEEPILLYDSLPEPVKTNKSFNLGKFMDLFKQRKFPVAIESLTEHVDLLTRDYQEDIFEFKSWLENIIFNITVLLGNMDFDVEELEEAKYDYFADINEAKHAKEAVARFHDFLEKVQAIVAADDSRAFPPNMQRLLTYIEEHYAESLSLTTLAEYFHFNPSYLSSNFKTHLKVGFSDYLNQVRIAKAKDILASSSASVSEVGEMVGYSETSYFCKVFKRLEGSSPGSYRKETSAAK